MPLRFVAHPAFATALLVLPLPVVAQTVYTVNATADPGTGSCDAAECTLREALSAANANPNGAQPDRVHFAIPGAGLHTIVPATALPAITDPVVIDAYTQPGASPNTLAVGNDAVLRVELSGNGATFRAFEITAGGSIVRGFVINRFDGNGGTDGFQLRTLGSNTIAGNWIGTSADGTTAQNNSRAAIYIENSAGNTIGGLAPADRNVLLGSANPIIYDQGTGGSHTIQGNYLGTDAQGTVPLGQTGVYLSTGGTLIGGTDPGAGNVISVTGRDGVFFSEANASDNTVLGNFIGVGSDGTTPLGFGSAVVIQRGSRNRIGGPTAAHRNVLGGSSGVLILGGGGTAQNNVVQGNYIGTTADGTALVLPSGGAGTGVLVSTASGNTVGGGGPGAGNVIAGFGPAGVRLENGSTGNTVLGNRIGTDAWGLVALPNGRGVVIFETGGVNTIGGSGTEGNVISGNGGAGLYLTGTGTTSIQGNLIGVAADGTSPLGNGDSGIEIGTASGTQIGGLAGNVIAHNGVHVSQGGIRVTDGTGTSVTGNAIYGNFGYGIDLGTDGATANDPGDPDDGPNRLQNTPEILTLVLSGGQLTIGYRVDTDLANATYPLRVEFFRSEAGQGAAFLGADTYASADHSACGTPPPCMKTVAFFPATAVTLSDALVATATDLSGNTSEFTAIPRPVPAEPDPSVPATTALYAPAPNPSLGVAVLRYDLAASGRVRLVVYDLLGREAVVLVDGELPVGSHTAPLDSASLPSGVYLVRLVADGQTRSQRVTLLR